MWIDDELLRRCHRPQVMSAWVPSETMVVLGSSNKLSAEVKESACLADEVPILKRYGGGGCVVLHSGCVVISLGIWVSHYYDNSRYFKVINNAVIRALQVKWPQLTELRQDGLSDLVYGTRKIAGTSLFRSRNYLLYQASILVEAKVDLMERYLKHPSREPQYRQGKSHSDFVAGLIECVPSLTPEILMQRLSAKLMPELLADLHADLIPAQLKQCPHLYRRAAAKSQRFSASASASGKDLNHVVYSGSDSLV